MKKLLAAALAAAFVVLGGLGFAAPASAQDGWPSFSVNNQFPNGSPKPFRATKTSGMRIQLTTSNTNDALSFGFLSDYISICVERTAQPIFVRLATALPSLTTTIGIFASGDLNVAGRALVIAQPASLNAPGNQLSSNDDQVCLSGPFRSQGVVVAGVPTINEATVNVWAAGD